MDLSAMNNIRYVCSKFERFINIKKNIRKVHDEKNKYASIIL